MLYWRTYINKKLYLSIYNERDSKMVEILDKDTFTVSKNGGSTRITVKSGWDSLLNIEPGDEVVVALANGKHGLHLAAWSKGEQPELGEIQEQI